MFNVKKYIASLFTHSEQPPADWCQSLVRLNEPSYRGMYSLLGREYFIEPLNDFGNRSITDSVLVCGSQTGKTTMLMAGVSWALVNDACSFLWVMPSIDLVRKFSRQRWMPMLEATPPTSALIPRGARRHDFKGLEQIIGASVINFVGSNSPSSLASNPCRRVILDEVDKFSAGTAGEADAVNLAEQRTKGQPDPQRWKTSTPTTTDGLIWQEMLKGDIRRYFMPCPNCLKPVVFSWSKHFTLLPITGCEAWVEWDAEAKTKEGWDFGRVEASAHAVCPHCAAHIRDNHKTAMIRNGYWKPTNPKATPAAFRSRHLSSLYACGPETTFGRMAVKFLQMRESFSGLQGFVNGDLAEAWEHQDSTSERVEITVKGDAAPIGDAPRRLMAVDVQQVSPYYWFVIRDFVSPGHSRLVAYGDRDDWNEIYSEQQAHGLDNRHVLVDSGYNSTKVYKACWEHGETIKRANALPLRRGWMPSKGREREAGWKDPATGLVKPYFLAEVPHQFDKCSFKLFEYNNQYFIDLLQRLRNPKFSNGIRWEILDGVTDDYIKHMSAYVLKSTIKNRIIIRRWLKRNENWPDHLYDCEKMLLAWAMFWGVLPLETNQEKPATK